MIVKMRHLDLVCVAADREATLEKLRSLGAVHLDLASAQGLEVAEARGTLAEAERAVRLITKARGKEKRESIEIRPMSVARALELEADRDTLIAERDRLEREIKRYREYGDFDPALAKALLAKAPELQELLPERLPELRLSKLEEKFERVKNRINIDTARLASGDERLIMREFPALVDRMAFAQAKELLASRGSIAVISGWIPTTLESRLLSVTKANGWGVLLRDSEVGETPPTLIEPPKLFRPVRALFNGLGIAPNYDESDVSIPFFCYFSLFFAMLVGDGAYGAIFLVGTLLLRKKLPKAWFILLLVFSLATIGWGTLSNAWFGASIPYCDNWPTVKWLSGVGAPTGHEYDNMMFLCFTIGVSHLMLARLWNGFSRINDISCLKEFGWAGIVLFMYILTNSIVGIFATIPMWAYYMLGVSFVTVFFSVKGIDKGMLFLNAMSVLGDIISYVRLFAVGLASLKVAENFNMMALNLGLPIWIKWLPLALILLIGHGLNLAMAGLSVLVHAVRLNTLEFSNHKGISWAGYAFKPFTKTKEKR